MPLPLILGAAAAVAGAAGVGSAIHGGVKMKKANDTMKQTQEAVSYTHLMTPAGISISIRSPFPATS